MSHIPCSEVQKHLHRVSVCVPVLVYLVVCAFGIHACSDCKSCGES